jgi:hypothetical protein
MKPLKNFEEFESQILTLQESDIESGLKTILPGLMMGDVSSLSSIASLLGYGPKKDQAQTTTGSTETSSGSKIGIVTADNLGGEPDKPSATVPRKDSGKETQSQVPGIGSVSGNDDFLLYMQHQQGVAGSTGIIKASLGTGSMHPDTVRTKSGVKYANLVMNIPSDRPNVKKAMIQALDSGDQKSAAILFMTMWKEKWNAKSKQAQSLIELPKNQKVKEAIMKYCKKYDVPFNFASTVATIESGLNPNAGNKRYKGLFALSQSEFNKYVPGGRINNIDDNANAGIQCLRNNIKSFIRYLGPTVAKINVSSWAKTA